MRLYRYITGKDDDTFCKRVSSGLNNGWELHGSPTLTYNDKTNEVICGQALVKNAQGEWNDMVDLHSF
ncbi:MAG: DUF1737 domain-containing protein [Alphaproteobacteria bacterium]